MRSAGCGLAFLGALVKSLRGKDVVGLAFDQHPCPLLCKKNTLEGQRGHQRGKGGERGSGMKGKESDCQKICCEPWT